TNSGRAETRGIAHPGQTHVPASIDRYIRMVRRNIVAIKSSARTAADSADRVSCAFKPDSRVHRRNEQGSGLALHEAVGTPDRLNVESRIFWWVAIRPLWDSDLRQRCRRVNSAAASPLPNGTTARERHCRASEVSRYRNAASPD